MKKSIFLVLLLFVACTPVVFATVANNNGVEVCENFEVFEVVKLGFAPLTQERLFVNKNIYVGETVLLKRECSRQTSKLIENKVYLKKKLKIIRITHYKKGKSFDQLE